MHIVEVIGRIFLSAIFLLAGVGKIFNYESTIEYMESFNVPGYLITPAIIIEILFPLILRIWSLLNSSKFFSTPKRLVFVIDGLPEKIEQKKNFFLIKTMMIFLQN